MNTERVTKIISVDNNYYINMDIIWVYCIQFHWTESKNIGIYYLISAIQRKYKYP